MSYQGRLVSSRVTFCVIVCAAIVLTACSTKRYGRQTPLSPGERASLTCAEIDREIEKSTYFIEDIQRQRRELTGAHVLGFLGDFGIGNVMEGDAAEASGMERRDQLRALRSEKGCSS